MREVTWREIRQGMMRQPLSEVAFLRLLPTTKVDAFDLGNGIENVDWTEVPTSLGAAVDSDLMRYM